MASFTIGNSGMMKVNPPDKKQLEILDVLKEEASEIIQAASKISRCGIDFQPTHVDRRDTARREFTAEILDTLMLIREASEAGLLDKTMIASYLESKQKRLQTWTHGLGEADYSGISSFLGEP